MTPPASASACARSSRPGWSSPSENQKLWNSPSIPCTQSSAAPMSGAKGCGSRLSSRASQVFAAWNATPSPAGRSVSCTSATGRPSRPASSISPRARSSRTGQSRAEAQEASISTSSGPSVSRSSGGFRTGPAKPMIAAATASIRKSSSHQGVLSVWLSSSLRPISSATPGKRLRIGAGGTARNSHHRIGKAISASNNPGAAKERPPIMGAP